MVTQWSGAAIFILLSFSRFIRLAVPFLHLSPLPHHLFPLCSIHLLAAFEVPPLQVQNAVSWESGVKEGRGNTPTTSKGFSWVVGRWGLFLALWCPFKRLAWRWRRRENRGRGYRKLMPHSHCCHTAMSYSKQTFFCNKMHIVFGMNGMDVLLKSLSFKDENMKMQLSENIGSYG